VTYSHLDRGHLVATVARLHERIRERFPDAGLLAVAEELRAIVGRHAQRSAAIRRPAWRLRLFSAALLLAGVATIAGFVATMRFSRETAPRTWGDTLQALEATVSMLFFLGAGAVYVASLEARSKRRRCLQALHELRALAHIVDLHQLTKDPDRALHPESPPASAGTAGPAAAGGAAASAAAERPLSPFLLTRYLDYCSEMLSLIGKVAALYAQDFPDPQAVGAVDDIEDLTTGLSRKIWQKIMILASHPAAEPRA
jgi:hypothetical protein